MTGSVHNDTHNTVRQLSDGPPNRHSGPAKRGLGVSGGRLVQPHAGGGPCRTEQASLLPPSGGGTSTSVCARWLIRSVAGCKRAKVGLEWSSLNNCFFHPLNGHEKVLRALPSLSFKWETSPASGIGKKN